MSTHGSIVSSTAGTNDYINPVTAGWESFYLTEKDADILTHCMELGTMSKTAVLRTALRYYEAILESEVN